MEAYVVDMSPEKQVNSFDQNGEIFSAGPLILLSDSVILLLAISGLPLIGL